MPKLSTSLIVCEAASPDYSLTCELEIGHPGWHRNAPTAWFWGVWDVYHRTDTKAEPLPEPGCIRCLFICPPTCRWRMTKIHPEAELVPVVSNSNSSESLTDEPEPPAVQTEMPRTVPPKTSDNIGDPHDCEERQCGRTWVAPPRRWRGRKAKSRTA